ncbi:melatonin receptor type 1A-like [Acanthaster planci]|uniref:Melatonin receptor type 1A-like n=1 Tax=Acanthaster planci TaxID=133434 RepID=A0A8B7XV76_ACAPL|nr:melatonin receptor type 1A-like [Acanthaster planci]
MENSTTVISILPSINSTEEPFKVYKYYYMRVILATLCIVSSVFGVVGNTLVICAVPLSKKLRTVTNVFIVNLSVSDLMACTFLPWQAVSVLSEDGWPLPQAYWLCVVTSAVFCLSICCSVTNLALIALNRWIGITKSAATTRRIYTSRNIACMIALSWAVPFVLSIMLPLLGIGEIGYEPLYSVCSWVKGNEYSLLHNILIIVFFFPAPLAVISLCYISIFRYVLKTSRRLARQDIPSVSDAVSGADRAMRKKLWKRQIAVTKNLVYIVLAYVICITPFAVSVIPLGYEWSIRLTPYAGAILFFNSCVNPIIYATSHPDFKEAFGFMVRCQCTTKPQSRAQSLQLNTRNQNK